MSTATCPSVIPEDLRELGIPPATEAGRKRAQKACLSCRSRKVRCDVSVVCQPCTNCQLHGKNCLVTGRGSRLAKTGRRRDRRNTDVTAAVLEAKHVDQPSAAALQQTNGMTAPRHGGNEETGDVCRSENGWDSCDLEQGSGVPQDHLSFHALESSATYSEQQSESHSHEKSGLTTSFPRVRPASLPNSTSTVTYSHFRFLTLGNIHKIPPQDVNYLESQGCLHVPMPPVLDDFIQHYFLHIHPLNPLINEGDFWDMYAQRDGNQVAQETMSLLLFQAMLFSSCTYVPFTSIQRLGFSSLRAARGEFYRKVKLLYDMDTETSPLPLAQTALLLMSWVPPSNLTLIPYKMWLSRAVQHTKSLNADRVAKEASPTATKHQKALRRLWWCCVSWDRVSPLCTRYTPYLRHDTFDFDISSIPTSKFLEDEVFRSCVYSPSSKQRLLSLFQVYMEFIIILTDLLSLTFPFDGSLGGSEPSEQPNSGKVAECSRAMKSWLARSMKVIPPSIGSTTDANNKLNLHKSVSVHVNLMYIYYNHSSIALSHTKLLQLMNSNIAKDLEACQLSLIQKELQEASQSMIQIFEDMNTHRLVRWLPISVLACMVFPLAFTVVTARLRAAADPNLAVDESDSVKSNQKDLSILMETMRSFLPQYDGVDLIKETVKHAADLAHTAGEALSKDSATPTTTWAQILVGNPKLYLRMIMSIDLSINKGRLAEDEDFPAGLFDRMRTDATPNYPCPSRPAQGFDNLPESLDQEMIPDLTSLWDVGSLIDVQCTNAPSSAGEPRKAGMNRLDVPSTETAWGGSSCLRSTGAELLWDYGNAYTADQFADTIETWAGIPLSDLEPGYPPW